MFITKLINNKIALKNNQKYALIIGLTPSRGARSPKLWNKVYKKKNSKIRMYPADVDKKKLKHLLKLLKNDANYIGGSVTAPYKIEIIKFLDSVSPEAKKIGSINTIAREKQKLIGYNTDYHGALSTLNNFKNKKRILILGAGGASKAVITAILKKFKNAKLFFYNRNKIKLDLFIKKIGLRKKYKIFRNHNSFTRYEYDLIVNTTSIGFDSWIKHKKKFFNLIFFSPLSELKNIKKINNIDYQKFKIYNYSKISRDNMNLKSFFSKNKKLDIFDIIYNPKKTKLIKFSEKYGNKIHNGLEMNLIQAVKAFEIVNKIKNLNFIKRNMVENGQ